MSARLLSLCVVGAMAAGCDVEVPIGRHDAGASLCDAGAQTVGPYRLDRAFGDCGRLVLDVGGVDNVDLGVQGLAVRPDGRVVLAGVAGSTANLDFLAVGLTSEGGLDPSFATNGVGVFDLGATVDLAEAVVLEPDGKVVLAGVSKGLGPERAAVLRLRADGTVDTSFGDGGVQVSSDVTRRTLCNGVARLGDGRLRCGGHGFGSMGGAADLEVFALELTGAPERSFGIDGSARLTFSAGDEFGGALVADARGRLLVPGTGWNGADFDFVLGRLLPDGSADPGFGQQGRVSSDVASGDDGCQSVVVQPDGRVVCSGSATVAGTSSATLIRYLDDGRRDPTFGVQGAVRLDWGPGSSANGTLVLASGELVVVGKATGASGDSALAVAVLEQGGNVKASQAFELGAADEARAVVLAPSGDVLVFGALRGVGGNDLLVVRLTTRPEPPAGGVRLLVGPSCSSAGAGLSPLLLLALWRFRPKSTRKSTEAAIHR